MFADLNPNLYMSDEALEAFKQTIEFRDDTPVPLASMIVKKEVAVTALDICDSAAATGA